MTLRWGLALAALCLLAGYVGYSIVQREVRTDTAQQTAQDLARPLATLCKQDEGRARAVGTDCARAAAVARDGVDGADGEPGRGVLGTQVLAGRLIVAYSDGTRADVGQVSGPVGAEGRGIAGHALEGGRLVVSYTDGTRADLGPVVGPAGRGIAGLDGRSGRLLVTLTDGAVVDAGPLPVGPAGRDGADGEDAPVLQRQTFTRADGSTVTCDRTGGSDEAAEFTCAAPVGAPTPPVQEGAG